MSELKTNKISTNDQNNVAIDNALGLKSYDTTARNALTSVAGDMIYNTTTSKAEYYTGSAWVETGGADLVQVEYLAVAGGGGGGAGWNNTSNRPAGGGGAGGLLTNVSGSTSGGLTAASPAFYVVPSTNYLVSIGAGGAKGDGAYGTQPSSEKRGVPGSSTRFATIHSFGGGGGKGRISNGATDEFSSGTAGGSQGGINTGASVGAMDNDRQGFGGGKGATSNHDAGGGGGAGAVGNGTNGVSPGGNGYGGVGVTNTIITASEATTASVGEVDGSDVYYAGGGGGGGNSGDSSIPDGGKGGGGRGSSTNGDNGQDGTNNTGGGGGGGASRGDGNGWDGSEGGSGVLILRYANTYSISQTGLTFSTITQGDNKVSIITAGTGTISFS